MQHGNVAAPGYKTWQCGWKLGRDFISFGFAWEEPKHTTTRTGKFCWNKFIQQDQSVTYIRVTLLDHRLAVISTALLENGGHFNCRRIACQLRRREYLGSTYMNRRNAHQKPGLGQRYRLQFFADSFGKCGMAVDENRDVGA